MLTLCDASKAQQQLGWAPRIPFEQTLSDILDYWRAQVAAHRG
jgi:GDP-4-dehydro-6-deoxy-D-mannose reductase